MTRIPPLDPARVDGLDDAFARQKAIVGLVPESLLTMAHRPRMAARIADLASEVLGPGTLESGLKQRVAYTVSVSAGCRYCQAHTARAAVRRGVDEEKVAAALLFETDARFIEAERAALALATDAAAVPNRVTDAHFDRLRRSFSDEQIVELVGVIALFGWLNRWNDTMATTLEREPLGWARETLSNAGWVPGKHAT